jgi:hypothetical protein
MILPIHPLWNEARLNFESPQAIRMFFSKTSGCDNERDFAIRYFYGKGGLMNSIGPDPSMFRVFKIDNSLMSLMDSVSNTIQKYLNFRMPGDFAGKVEFNSVELKFYLGPDICKGIKGYDGKYLRCDTNKKIGLHADCQFNDEGVQFQTDSAVGNHPIATVSIGNTRKLSFFEQKKTNGKWQKKNKVQYVTSFDLDHNSLFVLLP